MKKILIVIAMVVFYLLGFYSGEWANNKQRLKDEAFYFIKINNIYQATFDTDKTKLEKSIALLMKTHANRYLSIRSYSFHTEREDTLFCDALMFTNTEKTRFNDFVTAQNLNNYLTDRINFCRQPLDFIQKTPPEVQ